jgi:acetate kinase
MNILVINPGGRTLSWFLYSEKGCLITSAKIINYRKTGMGPEAMRQIKQNLDAMSIKPGIIALRVSCGGNIFKGAALMNDESTGKLKQLIPQAPFHIPMVLDLAAGARCIFRDSDVVFVFETAFFTKLPARERLYAISPEITGGVEIQRLGFHGILHEAGCRQAAGRLARNGFKTPAKILSICLEPRPEAAAAIGMHPVMATGGSTPLEGLPGDYSCGDLDIGIIIKLGHELNWGPEQINKVLTAESGFSGMLKRPTDIGKVFSSSARDCRLVQKFFLYRLLQVCGAAIAAMGSIDRIVFSGRYCGAGNIIGPRLLSKLDFLEKNFSEPRLRWEIMEQPVEKIMAEIAQTFIIENLTRASVGWS